MMSDEETSCWATQHAMEPNETKDHVKPKEIDPDLWLHRQYLFAAAQHGQP
jgi:hypothetical protein